MTGSVRKCARAFNKVVMGGAKVFWLTAIIAVTYEVGIDKLEERDLIDVQDTYKYTNSPQTKGNLIEAYSHWKKNASDVPDFYKMDENEIKAVLQSWASEKKIAPIPIY